MKRMSFLVFVVLALAIGSCNNKVATQTFPTIPPASTSTQTSMQEMATHPSLSNGQYRVVIPQVGLSFRYRPEIARSTDGYERDFTLALNIRNAAIVVSVLPRKGYSLAQLSQNFYLHWDLYEQSLPKATPSVVAQPTSSPLDGNTAIHEILPNTHPRVAFVIIERGDQCVLAIAYGGELDGDVIYSDSERAQILDLFNEVLATFTFSN